MKTERLTYRGWHIHYDPTSLPTRALDWSYYHDDYDGEGDNRCGLAGSVEECKAEIDLWWDEQGG